MLYPRKEEKQLDRELFRNPSSEYRGTPFWAWNCRVTKEQIAQQTEDLRQMGMGGAHVHCRTGMSIPYMSGEFLDLVSYAHDRFAEKDMLTLRLRGRTGDQTQGIQGALSGILSGAGGGRLPGGAGGIDLHSQSHPQ